MSQRRRERRARQRLQAKQDRERTKAAAATALLMAKEEANPQIQVEPKTIWQKLVDFIEQPLFLLVAGLLGGIVAVFVSIWFLLVCGGCILLAFHRAKVVQGEPLRVQIASYLALVVVTALVLWGTRHIIITNIPHIPTAQEIGDYVLNRQPKQGPGPTIGFSGGGTTVITNSRAEGFDIGVDTSHSKQTTIDNTVVTAPPNPAPTFNSPDPYVGKPNSVVAGYAKEYADGLQKLAQDYHTQNSALLQKYKQEGQHPSGDTPEMKQLDIQFLMAYDRCCNETLLNLHKSFASRLDPADTIDETQAYKQLTYSHDEAKQSARWELVPAAENYALYLKEMSVVLSQQH